MFKFKGISSNDMQVVIEEEEHFIARAARRYEVTEIEGRDGAIFNELGYSYVERPIYVQCLNTNKIDDILAWLDGEGEFEYKGRKTTARFYSQLEPQRETVIRIIDTTFIRDPFWTKLEDEFVEVKGDKEKNAEDENINIKGTIPVKFKEFVVGGNSKQERRSGKNVFNLEELTSTKITDTDNTTGTFTMSNCWAAVVMDNSAIQKLLKPSTEYKCIATVELNSKPDDISLTINNQSYILALYNGTRTINVLETETKDEKNNWEENTSKDIKINFTTPDDFTDYRLIAYNYYVDNAYGQGTFKIKNMMILEATEEDESFEPYGAMPSPEYPSEIQNVEGDVNITVVNKNLFKMPNKEETAFNNITYLAENQNIKINGTGTIGKYPWIIITKNNIYNKNGTPTLNDILQWQDGILAIGKITATLKRISGTSDWEINMNLYDESGEVVNNEIADTTKIVAIGLYLGNGKTFNNLILGIQIEKGEIATDYVEHQEQTVTFPLSQGQKLYKGDYLADDGIHHKRKQVEVNGTELVKIEQQNDNFARAYTNKYNDMKNYEENDNYTPASNFICSHFESVSNYSLVKICVALNDQRIYITISKDIASTISEFKSYLAAQKQAGTPVIIEYELAEEETEAYTEEQQEAYNQICNLKAYEGETNIYSTDEISPIFKVTYIEETTEKIENEGNIYSRPILRLKKTSYNNVDLEIAGTRFQYNFNDESYIEIDCEEKTALYEGFNRNRQLTIGYEFPKLAPGENDIKMYEGDCIIEVKRKDRWL